MVAGHYRLGTGLACKHDQVVVSRVTQNGRRIGWIVEHDSGIADDRDTFSDLLILNQLTEVTLSQRTLDLGQQARADNRLDAHLRNRVEDQARRALTARASDSRHQRAGVD